MAPDSLVRMYRPFGGIYFILKTETAAGLFETFVTTRRHKSEDHTMFRFSAIKIDLLYS